MGKSPVRKDVSLSPVPLNSMHSTTGDFFRWGCVKLLEMVPRDSISFSCDTFVQSAPNPFPINGSSSYGMHAFFCPKRLIWRDWKFYYTDLQSGLTVPYFTVGDLWDVFNDNVLSPVLSSDLRSQGLKFISDINGLGSIFKFVNSPTKSSIPSAWLDFKLSALPLRAVNRIWFDWMRDKMHISDNALTSYCYDTGGHISLQELILLCTPRWRNFPKNIFTSCFDNPQDGAASSVPGVVPSASENPGLQPPSSQSNLKMNPNGSVFSSSSVGATDVVSSTSINRLRWSNSIQQYRERLLVAGKTVLSRCLALLGVSPTIEELQMSNWLGGKDFELQFQTHMCSNTTSNEDGIYNEVGSFGYEPLNSTISGQKGQDITSPAGMGLQNISYRTDESGFFVVMGCVTPNVQYFQGLPKDWTAGLETFRSDKFDFFHSDMENQPFDPILFSEICCSPLLDPKRVFGFGYMYQRYKEAYDSIGGEYLLPASSILFDLMTMGRDIHSLVDAVSQDTGIDPNEVLTPAFLRQSSAYDAFLFDKKFSISDHTRDHFIINHKFKINALRPMQLFCLPSLDSSLSASTPKDVIDTGGFTV